RNRQRTSREAAAMAARDERHVVPIAEPDNRLHLLRGPGKRDDRRCISEMCEPVALVRQQLERIGDDPLVAANSPELADERGIDAGGADKPRPTAVVHAATPSVASNTS